MSNQHQNQRIETPMDDWRLVLAGAVTKGAEKAPLLRPGIAHDGSLKLTVFTNAPSDEGKHNGKIEFTGGPQQMEMLRAMLEKAASSTTATEMVIENHEFTWMKGQRSEDVKLRSKLHVGRTDDGRIYIAVLSYDNNRPKIRFYFGNNQKFRVVSPNDANTVSESEISSLWAKTWISAVGTTYTAYLAKHYRTKDERKEMNGRDNNNGNRGGNGGGNSGYNKPATSNDNWE